MGFTPPPLPQIGLKWTDLAQKFLLFVQRFCIADDFSTKDHLVNVLTQQMRFENKLEKDFNSNLVKTEQLEVFKFNILQYFLQTI